MTIIKNDVVNSGGNPIMQQGLDANKPSAGIMGRLYISTDTFIIYRDNVTYWQGIAGVGITPNLDDVTSVGNTTSNSIILDDGGGNLTELNTSQVAVYNGTSSLILSNGGLQNQSNNTGLVYNSAGGLTVLNSSTYTPTATVTTGTVTTITPNVAKYTIVNKLVTVYGSIYLLPNLASPPSLLIFDLSLPIAAKTGSTAIDLSGTGVAGGGASAVASLPFVIQFNAGTGKATCNIQGVNNYVYGIEYSFMYPIN
jgi:hypothetical protein